MFEKLLPPPFLFRFAVPCLYRRQLGATCGLPTSAGLDEPGATGGLPTSAGLDEPGATGGLPTSAGLDEKCRIPTVAALEDVSEWANGRAGWSEAGLAFWVLISGKRQRPWCRDSRIEDSDGLSVWIDTRDTHNVHRAGRFCHRFKFMPTGGGPRRDRPLAVQLTIDRAREQAKPVEAGQIQLRTEKRVDGYVLAAFIPAAALTGYDPAEHPRLGFFYQVIDREIGEQTFSVESQFPYASDPSLWGTLELVR